MNTRVGLVDKILCCTTAADVVWSDKKRRNTQGKAKANIKHLAGTAQSGSAAGSVEAGCEEYVGPTIKQPQRRKLRQQQQQRDCQHQGNCQGPHNSCAIECWAGLCRGQRAVECHDGIPGISAGIPKHMVSSGQICDKGPKEYGQVGRLVQEQGLSSSAEVSVGLSYPWHTTSMKKLGDKAVNKAWPGSRDARGSCCCPC